MGNYGVAIIHYHLRRGGVARVIGTDARCLEKAGIPSVVIIGEEPRHAAPTNYRVLPELKAGEKGGSTAALSLIQKLRRLAREALGTERVIWHFHNHAIGKSRAVSEAVGILAEAGEPLILQYHDFAEDGRPGSYRTVADTDTLYPIAPHVRHAFLNSRDRNYLIEAGLPEDHCLLHPNAVARPANPEPKPDPGPDPLVLYPARGIRRKNLGEICLLAALAPAGTRFAVTLAPENPRWHGVYKDWAAFAADTGLPVELDVVGRLALPARPMIPARSQPVPERRSCSQRTFYPIKPAMSAKAKTSGRLSIIAVATSFVSSMETSAISIPASSPAPSVRCC